MLTLVEKNKAAGHPAFAEFWRDYPKKEGKKYAEKCWLRLGELEKWQAIEALPSHIKKWRHEGRERQFVPDCSSWLNQARFEDEIDMTPFVTANGAAHLPAKLPDNVPRETMPDHVRALLARLRK